MKRIVLITLMGIAGLAGSSFAWADNYTSRNLTRGTIISASDLSDQTDVENYVGLEVTRNLRKGARLDNGLLRKPHVVKRNEHVTLVYQHGLLSLETTARTLDGGAVGDLIFVMNTSSRQKISAYIVGPGRVEVRS